MPCLWPDRPVSLSKHLMLLQVTLTVAAVGLNFRDVLNVLGLYPGDPGAPGSDCAGRVTAIGPKCRHQYR